MSTAVAEAPTKKKYRYRLLHGYYSEGRREELRTFQVERDPVTKKFVPVIIDTDRELDKENAPGMAPKFERVHGDPTPVLLNPLERMPGESIQAFLARLAELTQGIKIATEERLKEVDKFGDKQLNEFAEDNEIELKGAKTAEQKRAAIKAALKG